MEFHKEAIPKLKRSREGGNIDDIIDIDKEMNGLNFDGARDLY